MTLDEGIAFYRASGLVLDGDLGVARNYEGSFSSVPNDPLFPYQWHLQNTGQTGGISGADIGAVAAWDVTTGSPNVVVAVVDSCFDAGHPDLGFAAGYNVGDNSYD